MFFLYAACYEQFNVKVYQSAVKFRSFVITSFESHAVILAVDVQYTFDTCRVR